MSKEIQFSQITRGLSPEAETLCSALWCTGCMSQDVAHALAQHAASVNASRLTPEQILLCVLSDYMASPKGRHQLSQTALGSLPTPF